MFSSTDEMLPVEEPRFFLCLGWWSPGGRRGGVARPSEETEPSLLKRQALDAPVHGYYTTISPAFRGLRSLSSHVFRFTVQ